MVPFGQFKNREKHPWWSVTFSKVAGKPVFQACVFHVFKILQMVPNRAKHHSLLFRACRRMFHVQYHGKKRRNFFCLRSVPNLTHAQSFRKRTKSRGKFQ